MARFTPGPWKLETVKTSVGVCHKIGEFPSHGARPVTYGCVYEDGTSNWRLLENGTLDSELLANAVLMSLAPELLDALTDLADAGVEAWGANRPCVRHALNLIAKIAGEK